LNAHVAVLGNDATGAVGQNVVTRHAATGGDRHIPRAGPESPRSAIVFGLIILALVRTVQDRQEADDIASGVDSDIAAIPGADAAKLGGIYTVVGSQIHLENVSHVISACNDVAVLRVDRDVPPADGPNATPIDAGAYRIVIERIHGQAIEQHNIDWITVVGGIARGVDDDLVGGRQIDVSVLELDEGVAQKIDPITARLAA